MRRPITYAEGTKIVNDILGNEVKMLPNGVASTDNGDFNVAVAKFDFMQTLGYIVNEMYEANTRFWHVEDDGTANWTMRHSIEIFARGLATRNLVMQEWLDEVLANNTPLENITRYLDENV